MLNSDTKRHIDAARDVLVGVAPNPTTQIDQITYALIYKFMDDMDQSDFLQDVMSVPRDADFSLAKRHTTANTGVEKSDKREKSRFYRDLLTNLGLESILTSLEEENQLEIDFFQYAEKLNEAMIDQWKRETA